MYYKSVTPLKIKVSALGLGTWVFANDRWWGHQQDRDSFRVLEQAFVSGINLVDTAPVYGRGYAESLIGSFLKQNKLREKVILATKAGLSWQGRKVYHDLSKDTLIKELDESRSRLLSDYIDIYQVHWPDPAVSVGETAEVMRRFYEKGVIKAVGVSNYSLSQIKEFIQNSPLHFVQLCYNMFNRTAMEGIIPFCDLNNIGVLAYSPLNSGVLTNKFFSGESAVPGDFIRARHPDLQEPVFGVNKETLAELKLISDENNRTPAQLALAWIVNQPGISSVLLGARKLSQIKENIESVDWNLTVRERENILRILKLREKKIKEIRER